MANKWGCVLLLHEADVFMARRTQTNLQRNALVSVFLRVLEYYAGILFLTTSKPQLSVQAWYPSLTLEQIALEPLMKLSSHGSTCRWDTLHSIRNRHWRYGKWISRGPNRSSKTDLSSKTMRYWNMLRSTSRKLLKKKAMPALGIGGKFAMVGSKTLVMNVIIWQFVAFQTAIALAQWDAGPGEPAILDKKQF